MTEQTPSPGMAYLKACLTAVVVLAVVVAYIVFGTVVLKLPNPWVGLLAVTAWGGLYANSLEHAPKVFIGSAAALLVGASQWLLPTVLGPVAGAIVPLLIIILMLGGMLAGRCPVICNTATFIMLTIVTLEASIVGGHQHLLYLKDLAYGAVIFWFVPFVISKITAAKAGKKDAATA
jgi:hypothetical protein